MEQDKVIILSLIDPFGEKPHLAEKTHDELMEIFEKLNNSLYEYTHKDYAPSRVLQSLAKKFRDVSSKEQELVRREEAIKRKETEYGIKSQLRTREISQPREKTLQSTKSTPKKTFAKQSEIIEERKPIPVKTTRLIEEEHDPELEYAMKLSTDAFYQGSEHGVKKAISRSMEDARREEDESYRQQKIRNEEYAKSQSQIQDDFDDAFATSINGKNDSGVEISDEDLNIDLTKFQDKPSEITPEILKEICVLLKNQDFDGAKKIIGTLSAASSSWIVRLKCENGTLKSKMVSRDIEAYKCILCRK